jgi:hypothetical protein
MTAEGDILCHWCAAVAAAAEEILTTLAETGEVTSEAAMLLPEKSSEILRNPENMQCNKSFESFEGHRRRSSKKTPGLTSNPWRSC